jgi:putative transposase
MNRGVDHAVIFDDRSASLFLIELREACLQCRVQVHGYCILPNHYHLLLHTPHGQLSAAMQRLASRFTQRINKERGRDGPLFKGRFRSVAVLDDAHLLQVSRYIHLNPIEAGLVSRPEDWRWSSAAAYLGLTPPPDWLHRDQILAMFGSSNPVAAFAEHLQ